jgi:lipid-binding SYLF domain-containing protein
VKGFAPAVLTISALTLLVIGCSTEPSDSDDRASLQDDVGTTLKRLYVEDPGLQQFLASAYGYVVFPTVGKGAFIVGGSYGHGMVFQKGQFIGYADISQATVGLQAGGQAFSEAIAFENAEALTRFEVGQLTFAANASAVALKSGAAGTAKYTDGVVAFVEPTAGLMLEAAIGGQSFSYQPK